MRSFLLVVSNKVALRWIVNQSATAFPQRKRAEVDALAAGDRVILTTTRKCFNHPAKDQTRVVGVARVASPVQLLSEPLDLPGKQWDRSCDLELLALARYRDGIELVPLVPTLETFQGNAYWSLQMRSPLVELTSADGDLLERALARHVNGLREAIETYS